MTVSVSFLDKVVYTSQDFRNRSSDFFGSGVVSLSHFPISFPSPATMSCFVGAGTAWVANGFRVSNDSNLVTLTFATADTTYTRIDLIQVGVTTSVDSNGDTSGTPQITVKQGVPAANPIAPGPDSQYVGLFQITIPANATSIASNNVTDIRALVNLNVDGSQISNFSGATTAQLNAVVADLYGNTSVVLTGGVSTKDSTVPTQLDVTQCVVYFASGVRVSFPASQNGQYVTSAASSTYYLDLNPDSTASFATSHSTTSGYVTICQVTTDSSGNILTVTDERPLVVNIFGTTDTVNFGGNVQASKFIGDGSQLTNLPVGNITGGTGISVTTSGNTDTITNTGVISVNGQTGAVTVQGYNPLTSPYGRMHR